MHDPKQAAKFLSRAFVFTDDGQLLSPFRSRAAEILEILEDIHIPEGAVPVLSAERLSGNPHSGGFDARVIADRIAEVFNEARILIVIREQVSMILSTYFQFLRIGGTVSLQSYISQKYDGRIPYFSLAHFEYDRIIEYYQLLFGRYNVLVLPYEEFCRDPRLFVSQVAEFAGAVVPSDLEYEAKSNKGLPRFAEYYTRTLNALSQRSSVNGYSPWALTSGAKVKNLIRRGLGRIVSSERERAFVEGLEGEIRGAVDEYYAESNRRTMELIQMDLSRLGYSVAASESTANRPM